MLNLYVVGKRLENHVIYVCSIEETIKMMLNVYLVVKKLEKLS